MSTEQLLVIGGKNYSGYVTENDLKIKYIPVYDEGSEFTALDGNISRKLMGHRINISFTLSDIDEEAAKALAETAGKEKTSVSFAFPDEMTADFEFISLTMEPERICGNDCRWFASAALCSEVMPLDGL